MNRYVKAVLAVLLFLMAFRALAQQLKPWETKPGTEHPGWCGIIVTLNPPLDAAVQGGYSSSARGDIGPLLVPNEVTVDVPLELHPTEVIVASYPRGTEVADSPSELLTAMYRFKKVGEYARFRGQITRCPEEEDYEVSVYCRNFERYSITPGGSTIECRQIRPKDTRQPEP
jgi:hypothetical protein